MKNCYPKKNFATILAILQLVKFIDPFNSSKSDPADSGSHNICPKDLYYWIILTKCQLYLLCPSRNQYTNLSFKSSRFRL